MMVLLSILCEMGLGVEAGAARVAVGALETESMVNAFLWLSKQGELFCVYNWPSVES